MKYLLLFTDTEETARRTPDELNGYMARIESWWTEHATAGRLIGGEQLQGPDTATTVRHNGATTTVTDGPFIEAKETISGYGVADVANLDEALELAKTWPWGGTVEVRPVMEPPAAPAGS